MHRVEGKEGLVKDPRTGAIINVDDDAFKAARRAHQRMVDQIIQREALEKKVIDQENRLRRLEALLVKDEPNGNY